MLMQHLTNVILPFPRGARKTAAKNPTGNQRPADNSDQKQQPNCKQCDLAGTTVQLVQRLHKNL